MLYDDCAYQKARGKSLLFKYCFTELISVICLKYECMEFFLILLFFFASNEKREEKWYFDQLKRNNNLKKKSPPSESLEQKFVLYSCFTLSTYFHCTAPGLKPEVNSVSL